MAENRILVAEDDDDASLLMQVAFREAGMVEHVYTVKDGRETINYLEGNETYGDRKIHPWPSLLLLDLKMPRVDGFGVLVWWRKNHKGRDLPIVVMSSSNQERDIQRAMELGATSYCVKPCSFQYLVHVAAELRDRWLSVRRAPLARV